MAPGPHWTPLVYMLIYALENTFDACVLIFFSPFQMGISMGGILNYSSPEIVFYISFFFFSFMPKYEKHCKMLASDGVLSPK